MKKKLLSKQNIKTFCSEAILLFLGQVGLLFGGEGGACCKFYLSRRKIQNKRYTTVVIYWDKK